MMYFVVSRRLIVIAVAMVNGGEVDNMCLFVIAVAMVNGGEVDNICLFVAAVAMVNGGEVVRVLCLTSWKP